MKSLTDALAYVITFINAYPEDEGGLDGRLAGKVLENIAYELRNATQQELNELAASADLAQRKELESAHPRQDWVETYGSLMECMFGADKWVGNKRIQS